MSIEKSLHRIEIGLDLPTKMLVYHEKMNTVSFHAPLTIKRLILKSLVEDIMGCLNSMKYETETYVISDFESMRIAYIKLK